LLLFQVNRGRLSNCAMSPWDLSLKQGEERFTAPCAGKKSAVNAEQCLYFTWSVSLVLYDQAGQQSR
jgi:hypothetical protein